MGRGKHGKPLDHPLGSINIPFKAVVRQEIDAAVSMYVTHQNLVATHLLSHAAHALMRAYAKKKGISLKADIYRMVDEVIPEVSKAVIDGFSWAYNGLKHFKSETDGEVILHPSFTQVELFLCIGDYIVLFGEPSKPMAIFFSWYSETKGGVVDGKTNLYPSAALNLPMYDRLAEARAILAQVEALARVANGDKA